MNDSVSTPPCGCKGIRTCALCETTQRAAKLQKAKFDFSIFETYVYVSPSTKTAVKIPVHDADAAYSMDTLFDIQRSYFDSVENNRIIDRKNESENDRELICDNVILILDFITEEEEVDLVEKIDRQPWLLSQSGRRKQDYGPKVNFKQRKLKLDHYLGMPTYSDFLLDRMSNYGSTNALSNYVPFELCNLEYDPHRRSCIDFHIDDTWIWGERLISINLLAGSVMTMVYEGDDGDQSKKLLYVPMPRRSLLCMAGPMRYQWRHGVLPEHIQNRRIALTMREPAKVFQPEGELYEKWGRTLIERAKQLIEV